MSPYPSTKRCGDAAWQDGCRSLDPRSPSLEDKHLIRLQQLCQARVSRVQVAADEHSPALTPELAADVAALWKHPAMLEVLKEADECESRGGKDENGKDMRLDLDDNAKL
jgi:DNA relaxase NicK